MEMEQAVRHAYFLLKIMTTMKNWSSGQSWTNLMYIQVLSLSNPFSYFKFLKNMTVIAKWMLFTVIFVKLWLLIRNLEKRNFLFRNISGPKVFGYEVMYLYYFWCCCYYLKKRKPFLYSVMVFNVSDKSNWEWNYLDFGNH